MIQHAVTAPATLDDLRQWPHWSYSAINQFLRICQVQFAYQRVWGLKPSFVADSLAFGSALHRAVEFFWHRKAEGGDASADDLASLFAKLWAREIDETPTLQFQKEADAVSLSVQGQAMVRAYRDGIGDLGEIVGINVPFRIPLIDTDGLVLDKPLIGEIDLIVGRPDGQIITVDLKTAGQRYSEAKVATDLQPVVYLAARYNRKLLMTG